MNLTFGFIFYVCVESSTKQQLPIMLCNKVNSSVTGNGVCHGALEPCRVCLARFSADTMQQAIFELHQEVLICLCEKLSVMIYK